MIYINIFEESDKIVGEIIVDSYFFEKNKYDYAYYFFNNGKRVSGLSYSNSMEVSFNINDMRGDFYIKCYFRDKRDDSKIIHNSNILSINN
tara:strand:- start:1629 stop:1901 length:273 start_codon:yes stop_codon:yes gene_type:complete